MRKFRKLCQKKAKYSWTDYAQKIIDFNLCNSTQRLENCLTDEHNGKTISLPRKVPKGKMVSQSATIIMHSLKNLIWLYFFLLLFEGALRKWFLPGLSQGLLNYTGSTCDLDLLFCFARGVISP